MLTSASERQSYDQMGFHIVRDLLSKEELPALAALADRYRNLCLSQNKAKLGERRVNLASPDLVDGFEPDLLNVIARPNILALSEELARGPLKSNGYFMNISEAGEDTTMAWHQDEKFLPKDLPPSFEVKAFTRRVPFSQIQWNLSLLEDSALWIVPGSQLRDPTQQEVIAMGRESFDLTLPGKLRVDLRAGDGVVYHNNLIHGLSDEFKRKRRTLHWYWVKREDHDPYDLAKVTIPAALRERLHPNLAKLL